MESNMTAEYNVYLRDKNFNIVGVFTRLMSLDLNLLFNQPSNWILKIHHDDPVYQYITKKSGIIVERDGEVILSGFIRGISNIWNQKDYSVQLSGSDDTVLLARRLCYCDVTGPPYSAQAYDIRTGALETIIKQLVYYNAGMGATPERRLNGLTIEPDYGRGSTVTARSRFAGLLETIATLTNEELGFRIRNMQFEMYDIVDKTATVMFSAEAGNLSSFEYVESDPIANYVIAAGAGDGTARAFEEDGDDDSILDYGRIEKLIDVRDTSTAAEMQEKIAKELETDAYTYQISIQPIELDGHKYMVDYTLGDKVLFTMDETRNFEAIIKAIRISTNGRTEAIVPTIAVGDISKYAGSDLMERLSKLEATQ